VKLSGNALRYIQVAGCVTCVAGSNPYFVTDARAHCRYRPCDVSLPHVWFPTG
jgi:hypothetical protein